MREIDVHASPQRSVSVSRPKTPGADVKKRAGHGYRQRVRKR